MKNFQLIERKFLTVLILVFTSLICFGQTTFQKKYGGSSYDHSYYIIETSDGGFVFTGETKSFGAGGFDVYLIKTDNNGNLLWSKTFGGMADDRGDYVMETSDKGFLIGGSSKSFGAGNSDAYLIKTDSIGNLIWSQTFVTGLNPRIVSVSEVNGGYIFTMPFNGVVKTDANGNIIWSKNLFSSNIGDLHIYDIRNTNDGGLIFTGRKDSSIAYHQVCLIKMDSLNNIEWSKVYFDGSQSQGFSVTLTSDGGYAITGYSFFSNSHKILFMKTDSSGNLNWLKTIGPSGNNRGLKISELSDGSFVMSGYSYNGWSNDFALVKLNSFGDIEWFKRIGSQSGDDHSYSHILTDDGAVALTGFTYGFNADTGDVYLVKTDISGIIGCNETSPVTSVLSPTTNIGVLNISENLFTIAVGNPATVTGTGGFETIICSLITESYELENKLIINIYPNPASSILNIHSTEKIDDIEIVNLFGNRIYIQNFSEWKNQNTINVQSLKSGIYFYKLKIDQKVYSGKFAVIK